MPDAAILRRATELGRVIFTPDDDFLAPVDQTLEQGSIFAGVIYASQLAITIGQAVHDLELIAKVFNPNDMLNRVEILPY